MAQRSGAEDESGRRANDDAPPCFPTHRCLSAVALSSSSVFLFLPLSLSPSLVCSPEQTRVYPSSRDGPTCVLTGPRQSEMRCRAARRAHTAPAPSLARPCRRPRLPSVSPSLLVAALFPSPLPLRLPDALVCCAERKETTGSAGRGRVTSAIASTRAVVCLPPASARRRPFLAAPPLLASRSGRASRGSRWCR